MFRKAGVIALATAGLLLAGGPAIAHPVQDDPVTGGYNGEKEQFGLINTADVDVLDEVTIPICLNDINLLLIVVDILSPSGMADSCDVGAASDNGDGH